jgi:excisionase family DNA binding protein
MEIIQIIQSIQASNQAIMNNNAMLEQLIQSVDRQQKEEDKKREEWEEKAALMTFDELGEYLKQSPNALRTKYKDMKIPYFQIGRSIRFRRYEVDGWLETKKVSAGKR